MKRMKKGLCAVLALLLLCALVPTVSAANYTVSSATLSVGKNTVSTSSSATTTLYVFKPTKAGNYKVAVDQAAATLSYWHGSKFYVTGLAEETKSGSLTVTCTSVGQSLLIGVAGVSKATVTITEQAGYVPRDEVVYEAYQNVHTPVKNFAMPNEELVRVNVMQPQTVVTDAAGIYHLDAVDGPVLYVNMCAATYADLYACYHPSGGTGALSLRGTYTDGKGKTCGYEFLEAMRPYAEALDGNGYYYLTVDLAKYIQVYGKSQGWFRKDVSPFAIIKQGRFIEESAWLVNAYYVKDHVEMKINGDVNGDGKNNNKDLAMLQQYVNGWVMPLSVFNGDVNGDGNVNNKDLAVLQQALNGWDVS